ncbi:hypothetical protein V1478_015936, partial [Vespula squamosa]
MSLRRLNSEKMYKLIYSRDLYTLSPFYMAAYTTKISRFTSDQAGDLLSTNRYLAILEILGTPINSSYEITSRVPSIANGFSLVNFKKHDQSSVFSDVKRGAHRHQFGTTFEHKRGLYNLKWRQTSD